MEQAITGKSKLRLTKSKKKKKAEEFGKSKRTKELNKQHANSTK